MDSMRRNRTAGWISLALTVTLAFMSPSPRAQNLVWSTSYGGTGTEEGYSGTRTPEKGYIALGSTFSYGAGDYDFYVLCLDSLGDTLWTRTYGGPKSERGYDIQLTSDSCYIIVGTTWSYGAGQSDIYILKINRFGTVLWSKTVGGPEKESGRSIRQTLDNGYIVCGSSAS